MNKLIIIFCILIASSTIAQKTEIQGCAINSYSKGRVRIVLNDTLRRVPFNDSIYDILLKNKDYVNFTSREGNFKMWAKPTDTLFFYSPLHIPQSRPVSDFIFSDSIITVKLEPEPCIEKIPCKEEKPELYVFIGKKIHVENIEELNYCNVFHADSKYQAKYEILKNIYGNFPNDTIEFISYDHSSIVRYDEFDYVMLYVANYCGRLIHVKYQFDPVYKTVDGNWASPVVFEYNLNKRKSERPPHRLKMAEPIKVLYPYSENVLKKKYPKKYFSLKKGKVYLKYGYYDKELFAIRKPVLDNYGFFK